MVSALVSSSAASIVRPRGRLSWAMKPCESLVAQRKRALSTWARLGATLIKQAIRRQISLQYPTTAFAFSLIKAYPRIFINKNFLHEVRLIGLNQEGGAVLPNLQISKGGEVKNKA